MRAQPKPRTGPVIDQDLPPPKLRHRLAPARVGDPENHRPAALGRVARAAHRDLGRIRKLDQQLRLPLRLRANRLDANLVHDLIARPRGIHRRHIGSPRRITLNVVRIVDRPRREGEGTRVRRPAGRGRLEIQPRPYVQIARARPAQQPLDRAARREVHAQLGNR